MMLIAQVGDAVAESAQEDSVARLYRSNAERCETGFEHVLTPWLTLSGLAELEASHQQFTLDGEKGREY